jgi:dienelactone hydrolase
MDTLVLDAPGKMPTSIMEKPAKGLSGVQGAALLSPWCSKDVTGFNLIKAVHEDFATQVPMIAVIPQSDTESDQDLCLEILNRNKAKGASIEAVIVEDAGHTFAQGEDDYGVPFADHDPIKAKKAWNSIYAFFQKRFR